MSPLLILEASGEGECVNGCGADEFSEQTLHHVALVLAIAPT